MTDATTDTLNDHNPDEANTRRRPFVRKGEPQSDDLVNIQITRAQYDEIAAERDRTSPATDSMGNKRPREGMNTYAQRLLAMGTVVSRKNVPDYSDPYSALTDPGA